MRRVENLSVMDSSPKGPVLGPMVICGVEVSPKIFSELRAERVRDSKMIGPNRREFLDKFLKEKIEKYEIVEYSPFEIDQLRSEGVNMNQIEARGFAKVLNLLRPSKAYIDSASASTDKFESDVGNNLDCNVDMVVEHKADESYLPVSAASIIAKVRRDERIEDLKEEYGEIGSGYPSDDRTIRFLESWIGKNKDFPDFVRKSWKTAQRFL